MGFNIGNIKIKNKVVLAPMAGISNAAFIQIVEKMGAGLAYTELISAEAIIRNNKKTFDMLKGLELIKIPVAVQLFGSTPDVLSKAAKIITERYKNVFIDINMGCPVPKVAIRSNSGSALLKDPEKIKKILVDVTQAVKCPVTVKIRSGWDSENINAVEIAKICEDNGASAICIHPRTRSQGYSGKADWNIIKKVKETVKIPVIGNGDIRTIYDAKRMLEETNCDAIMIGRALLGNPWFIKEINEYIEKGSVLNKPTAVEKVDMVITHLNNLSKFKTEHIAVLEIRSHIAWYLKGLNDSNDIRQMVYKEKKIKNILEILVKYKNELLEDKNEDTNY